MNLIMIFFPFYVSNNMNVPIDTSLVHWKKIEPMYSDHSVLLLTEWFFQAVASKEKLSWS